MRHVLHLKREDGGQEHLITLMSLCRVRHLNPKHTHGDPIDMLLSNTMSAMVSERVSKLVPSKVLVFLSPIENGFAVEASSKNM